MSSDPSGLQRLAVAAALWLGLYLGVAAVLVGVFLLGGDPTPPLELVGIGLSLSLAVTGLALLAVVVDRLVFSRNPESFLTRQSLWVLVFVGLTIATTWLFYPQWVAGPGDAVLFGIAAALPTTLLLFAAVNLARYRSMEHGV